MVYTSSILRNTFFVVVVFLNGRKRNQYLSCDAYEYENICSVLYISIIYIFGFVSPSCYTLLKFCHVTHEHFQTLSFGRCSKKMFQKALYCIDEILVQQLVLRKASYITYHVYCQVCADNRC